MSAKRLGFKWCLTSSSSFCFIHDFLSELELCSVALIAVPKPLVDLVRVESDSLADLLAALHGELRAQVPLELQGSCLLRRLNEMLPLFLLDNRACNSKRFALGQFG